MHACVTRCHHGGMDYCVCECVGPSVIQQQQSVQLSDIMSSQVGANVVSVSFINNIDTVGYYGHVLLLYSQLHSGSLIVTSCKQLVNVEQLTDSG